MPRCGIIGPRASGKRTKIAISAVETARLQKNCYLTTKTATLVVFPYLRLNKNIIFMVRGPYDNVGSCMAIEIISGVHR